MTVFGDGVFGKVIKLNEVMWVVSNATFLGRGDLDTDTERECYVNLKTAIFKQRRNQPCQHLNLKLLACRTVRKQMSVV